MAVVAEVAGRRRAASPAWASRPATASKRGVVVNIDATVQPIQQALKEAEMMADRKITRLHRHHRQPHPRPELHRHGDRARQGGHAGRRARVVERLKINIPNDQRLLLVQAQEPVIDGHEVKPEPIGMSGGRLG